MKTLLSALLLVYASTAMAKLTYKRSCPLPVASPTSTSLEQFSQQLSLNNISILSGNVVSPQNVDFFFQSYNKFPESLRTEMVTRGARMTIMEGTGVAIDPTLTDAKSFDGRDWSVVPGSGGEVSEHYNIPTRIVINRLNHGHGTTDLVLHEHAHTLDSLYGRRGISSSDEWLVLFKGHNEFARLMYGNYTANSSEEAFAELFAYYHDCETTKKHMEEEAPELAAFFQNLTSVKNYLNGSVAKPEVSIFAPPTAPTAPAGAKETKEEECQPTPTLDFTPFLESFVKFNNSPKETLPVYPTSQTGVSAEGMK
jgi:hypothetical protein